MQRVAYQLEDRRDQPPDSKGSRNCFLSPFSRGDRIVLSVSLMVNQSHVYSVAELLWYSQEALTSEQTLHHKVLNQYVLTQRRLVTEAGFLGLFLSLRFLYTQHRNKASFRKSLESICQAGSVILEGLSFLSKEGHQITCHLQQKNILFDTFLHVNCSKKCDVKYFVNIRRLIEAKFCALSLSLANCCLYLAVQIHKSLQYSLKENTIQTNHCSIHCNIIQLAFIVGL